MSLIIHNGFRIHADLNQTYRLLALFRQKLQPMAERAFHEAVFARATYERDAAYLKGAEPPESPLEAAHRFYTKAWEAELGRRDSPCACFGLSIRLFPASRGNYTHALYHGDRPEYEKVWAALWGVEPFPYWDNLPPPEGTSSRQWKLRGNAWRSALESTGGEGFLFQYPSHASRYPPQGFEGDVAEVSPNFRERYREAAMRVAWEKWLPTQEAQGVAPESKIFVWMERDRSELVGKEEDSIRKRLPGEVTLAYLRGGEP